MKLRNKLALGYTIGFTLLLGLTFTAIYLGTDKYRKEEFYDRLKERARTTFRILTEVAEIDHDLLQIFDRNTINSVDQERILLFDSEGKVIYTSLDDTQVWYSKQMLARLRAGAEELELNEDGYELVGIRFVSEGKVYYGIAKAYDFFGKSKLEFLKWLLIGTFAVAVLLLVLVSVYLSRIITQPITRLADDLETISTDDLSQRVSLPAARDEIHFLAGEFNQLLDRVERAFRFQQHFIHHLSHELKTPLAVMMANTERALAEPGTEAWRQSLHFQQDGLMELSHIIDAMMDISRSETQPEAVLLESIRVDELLIECMEEISTLNPRARFDLALDAAIADDASLTVRANGRMLKLALLNLLKNAVNYAGSNPPRIDLKPAGDALAVVLTNDGPTLTAEEQGQLFRHLFRGQNSQARKGFGLGLVLVQRVAALHHGSIAYRVVDDGMNSFELTLPVAKN